MEMVFYDTIADEIFVVSGSTFAAAMVIISVDTKLNTIGLKYLGAL